MTTSDDPYVDPDLYDLEYGGHDEDIAHYLALSKRSGGPVLELGCGTGRLLLPIARSGITAWGVDLSEPMLSALRDKLQHEAVRTRMQARVLRGDFRTLRLIRRFPLVMWPFNAIHHCADADDVRRTLDTIRGLLTDRGRLAVDAYLPDLELYDRDPEERFEPRSFVHPRTGAPLESWEQGWWDADTQVHHVVYTYQHPDGRQERAHLRLRMYPLDTLRQLLREQGWELEHEAQDFEGTPLGPRALKWVAVARPLR